MSHEPKLSAQTNMDLLKKNQVTKRGFLNNGRDVLNGFTIHFDIVTKHSMVNQMEKKSIIFDVGSR